MQREEEYILCIKHFRVAIEMHKDFTCPQFPEIYNNIVDVYSIAPQALGALTGGEVMQNIFNTFNNRLKKLLSQIDF